MKRFIQRHAERIRGVLSGFDRLRFRGTFRWLAYTAGMRSFLSCSNVLLKDFKVYVEGVTNRVRQATQQLARTEGRPLLYLNSSATSKEEKARQIAERDNIREGLICIFSAVEPCFSYEVHRSREQQLLELQGRPQKCLHYYFYLQHLQFGLMYVRLQTWFPLTVHIGLNGREWLARQLDAEGIGYRRHDNCFLEIDDFQRAQELSNAQQKAPWKAHFNKLMEYVFPTHQELVYRDHQLEYYWSLEQSEWATDVVFRSTQDLAQLYPSLLRHGLHDFSSPDVMRFLGRKTPAHGGVNGNFQGEVVSDIGRRADHLRIKHRLDRNWIKMYDKQGSVLRVETTLNDVRGMKVFRRTEGQRGGKPAWHQLRKGVADVSRRAQVSHAANKRYLDSLASVQATEPLGKLADRISQPTTLNGRRVRGLQPWSAEDARLLSAVNRPEFTLQGFRNRDLRPLLFDSTEASASEARRQSAKVTRQLRLLRAHGLITKIPHTHRYQLTALGRTVVTALAAARQANAEQLSKLAA